ncbi:hypothetical protein [Roseibium aggregatum]|uniref:PepSY domain-containing protein n=1 Tax=Roseibium aggregatum TaxID=187304 RepID=A0A926P1S8_9HYPH|nr:hypothetical protein [Roseibium aggregatum]MBD1548431.1 hypothetical protein [Roseibium aggregatum]
MSILKTLVSAPLAGAFLITAVSLGGVASAQAAGAQFKTSGPVAVQDIGFRGGPYGGRHWHGERPGRWERLGPRQIRRSLRHRGFHRIRILDVRGPVYVIKARGWRGARVRLVVDAFNGRILRQHVIGHRAGWGHRW